MNNVITVSGIVLSSMPVGEYDRRIVLLTKERGKISAFAKGSRRVNSSLMGITRAFAFGKFELYEGRTSYDVRGASISQYFTEVTEDCDSIFYAFYFAEFADYYGKENLEATQIINVLYLSLKALTKHIIPKELVRYIFELRMIYENGECPDFFSCVNCGANEKMVGFSMQNMGMVCEKCKTSIKDVITLSESTIHTLQFITSINLEKLYTFTVNEEVLGELRRIVNRIRSCVIDKKMKSLEMIE